MRMSHQRETVNGRSRWEWDKIVSKVAETIVAHQDEIDSIAVNTWGVDFGLIGSDGKLLCNPVSYRDARHNEGYDYAQEKLSLEDIFMATGNQIMSINSLFQLLVYKKDELEGKDDTMGKIDTLLFMPDLLNYMLTGQKRSELTIASTSQILDLRTKEFSEKIMQTYGISNLFMPDLLNYMLTGQKRSELTIASTSQILDLRTKEFSEKIMQTYGISKDIFAPVIYPTEVVGSIKDSLIPEVKALNKDIPVIACASHDTASAVLLTEAYTDRDTAFLSCGTWSLIGGLTDEPVICKDAFARDLTNETGFALLTEAYTDRDTAFLSCGTWSLIGGLTDEPVICKDAFARDLTNETGFAGSNMFFKNITGLYILEMLKSDLESKRGEKIPFSEITEYVKNCPITDTVDVDAAVFSQNEFDVKEAIDGLTHKPHEHDYDYFKVNYLSLVLILRYLVFNWWLNWWACDLQGRLCSRSY